MNSNRILTEGAHFENPWKATFSRISESITFALCNLAISCFDFLQGMNEKWFLCVIQKQQDNSLGNPSHCSIPRSIYPYLPTILRQALSRRCFCSFMRHVPLWMEKSTRKCLWCDGRKALELKKSKRESARVLSSPSVYLAMDFRSPSRTIHS